MTPTSRSTPRVRRFRSDDVDGFLDLYEAVWGRRPPREWFDWRFEAVPYAADVPVIVADDGDELVGAEPSIPFRVGAGGETALAYQPADWIVHPDHRRQGIFTRMTERLLDDPPSNPPRLYFNFPSEAIVPGLRKFGWRVAGPFHTAYRVRRPSALLGDGTPGPTASLGRALDAIAGGYGRVRDALAPDPDVAVTRHDAPPAETLAALYRSAIPDRLHVVRDESFYRWRFANPLWTTTAYVARRDGRPVASLVVTERASDPHVAFLADTLPLVPPGDRRAYAALLRAAMADTTADVVRACDAVLPSGLLRAFGFYATDSFPLSRLSTRVQLAVRPGVLGAEDAWRLGGRALDDVDDWHLSLSSKDIG